jgi:opacity protein-like surface antigen
MTCLYPVNARATRRRNHARFFARALAVAPLLATAAMPATAADWLDDTLRGTVTSNAPMRWDGVNLGVTMGLSSMNTDFGSSTGQQIAYTLRNTALEDQFSPSTWTALPSNTTNSRQFGGFIGYNMQWQELVLGIDAGYIKPSSSNASASDSMSRVVTLSDGTTDGTTISARASIKLVDYATVRARAGYAFGQFLPYAVLGVAVGRFNYSVSTDVTVVQTPSGGVPSTFVFPTVTQSRDGAFSAGPVFGLGMDVAILPNMFLRAEWEYAAFAPVSGIRTGVNTGRVGLGVRF